MALQMQCRACLATNACQFITMESVLAENCTYLEAFNLCTRLEAAESDALSGMICQSCEHDLQVSYNFLQTAIKADAVQRQLLVTKIEQEHELEAPDNPKELNAADEEFEVEELLEEEVEVMEIETVEQGVLENLNEKSTLVDLLKTEAEEEQAITLPTHYPEDEVDDEYLVEYKDEELEEETTGAKWKCIECKRVLRGDVSYEGHMNMHKDARPYTCAQCECSFRCKVALERHTSIRHPAEENDADNVCKKCKKDCRDPKDLEEHMKLAHSAARNIKCPFCTRPPVPRSKIAQHFYVKHPEAYEKFFKLPSDTGAEPAQTTWQCEICHRYLRSNTELINHRNVHLDLRPHKCDICSKTYRSLGNLRAHLRALHPEEYAKAVSEVDSELALVRCEICNKTFQKKNLEKHMTVQHVKKPEEPKQKFLCAFCSSEHITEKSLHQHEKTHKRETDADVAYMCQECDRSFATLHLLRNHHKHAHKERNNVCDLCGNAFKLKNQLINHMKLHLGKDIQCPQCDKKYAREFDLRVHMRSHTGELPYACGLCDKRFAIKVRLTYHLQKHYGIKHHCKECGATFNSKQKLKAHSYKHTGMPYRCTLCDDDHGFAIRGVFKKHLLRVHNAFMSDEHLTEMFQQNTGKATHIKTFSEVQQIELEAQEIDGEIIKAEDIAIETEVIHT